MLKGWQTKIRVQIFMIRIRAMTEADDDAVCEISSQCYHFAVEMGNFTSKQIAIAQEGL